MYTLNKVRDLVLDFAQKTAETYCYKGGNKDILNSLRDEFVKNMLSIREQMPTRLFLNYNNITENEAASVFQKIKSSVQNTYRIPGISGVTFSPVNIGGNIIEIPSYLWLFYKRDETYPIGTFIVYYDTNETKRSIINSIVLNTLISLPIKKIRFTFVDLGGAYESELLLRHLPPSIYNEHPIASSSQMEEFLKRMEKRKEELITKYGDYPTWCKNHHEIPVPYEIIVLYDGSYLDEYRLRLNSIIEYGVRLGVFFIVTKKVNKYAFGPSINSCIFDKSRIEILVDSKQNKLEDSYLPPYTGVTYHFHKEEGKADYLSIFLNPLNDSEIVEGYGDYEVILEINKESFAPIPKEIVEAPHILACFPSKELAQSYQECVERKYRQLMPSITVRFHQVRSVYIPILCIHEVWLHEYIDDLYFYLSTFLFLI